MGCHQPTKDHVARRTAEGKTKTEIMRCLQLYIAREVFPYLLATAPDAPRLDRQTTAASAAPSTHPTAS